MQLSFLFFLLILVASLVWIVICVGTMWRRRRRRGSLFPKQPDSFGVLFEERWTSGRSHKSRFTKLDGAHNCLWVRVTEDEVWVKPHIPWNLIAEAADLEHRIAKRAINNVERTRKTVIISFSTEDGQSNRLELHLRNPDGFLSALGTPIS